MNGMRCERCGEVRWSIFGRGEKNPDCPCCGERMVPERRYPGRRAARLTGERRQAPSAASSASGSSSGRKWPTSGTRTTSIPG